MDNTNAGTGEETTTHYRPPLRYFWGGLILAAFGVLAVLAQFLPGKNGDPMPVFCRFFFTLFGTLYAGLGIYLLAFFFRFRVLLTDTGIRWRGVWHGWRTATWAQVSDFYTDTGTNGERFVASYTTTGTRTAFAPTSVVVTESGSIRLPSGVGGSDDLQRTVQARATAARVDRWQQFGTRRVDPFPRTFRYWSPPVLRSLLWRLMEWAILLTGAGFGLVRLHTFYAGVTSAGEANGIVPVLWFAFAVLFSLPAYISYRYATLYARRGITFTATPETLTYADARTGVSRTASWGDVTDYFYGDTSGMEGAAYTLVLSGADEAQWSWTPYLHDSWLLLALVQTYAPTPANARNATETDPWRVKNPHADTGGSDPATWTGGAVGMGGRVFSCRNGEGYLLLGVMTLMSALLVGGSFAIYADPKAHEKILLPLFAALFGVPTLWSWVCILRNTRVETDDMGLTQHTPFGKTYLPWFAVAQYREIKRGGSGFDHLEITGQNGVRLRLFTTLRGFDELRGEIEQRAPLHAQNNGSTAIVLEP